MRPVRTSFDAELSYLAVDAQARLDGSAAMPLRSLGEMRPATSPRRESPSVQVKLLVTPGSEERAADEVRAIDGSIASMGPLVLLADIPADRLGEIDQRPWLLRAEAPRPLHPFLDVARGPVTGAAQAAQDFGVSGEGVVVGIIDSGVDWTHPDFQNAARSFRAIRPRRFAIE